MDTDDRIAALEARMAALEAEQRQERAEVDRLVTELEQTNRLLAEHLIRCPGSGAWEWSVPT